MKKIGWLLGALLLLNACALQPMPQYTPTPTASPTPTGTPLPEAVTPVPDVSEDEYTPTPTEPPDVSPQRVPISAPPRLLPTPFPSPTRPAARETHVPILMYHHIAVPPPNADAIRLDLSVWPDNFDAQMAILASQGYHTVTLADVYNADMKGTPLPSKPIVFTFDDGYDDNYTNALPILKKYNFTGTFYIASGLLERPGYMTWAQVVDLYKQGMDIEAHSVTHPSLKGKPVDFLLREIGGSKRALESMLGHPILFFCYPSGEYDDLTIKVLQETGFLSATTTKAGAWQNAALPYEWPRVRVHGSAPAPEVAKLVHFYTGLYPY